MSDLTGRRCSGWHILGEYIAAHPIAYIVAVLSIAASSMLAAIIPRLVGRLADTYSAGSLTVDIARHIALLILGVGTVRVFFGWLGRFLTAQHGRVITFKIREALFRKWETLTPAYYHKHSTGELLSHALSDVDVVRQVAAMGINTAINGVFMLGASMYFMFAKMHWKLAVAGLIPLLGIPVLIRYFGPKIKNQSGVFQASLGRMSQTVEEIVGGIRTVKAFSNEGVVLQRFEAQIGDLVNEKMKFVRLSAVFGALIPLMSAFGFISVIWYGGYLAIHKEITLGVLVEFLLYLTLLKQPLEQLGNMLNTVQRASASLGRLSTLLEVVPDTVDELRTDSTIPSNGEIVVKNLSFRYPGAPHAALQNLSFSVKPGKTLGIVGSIGSGKTTLAHLLLRLYEPPEGSVFVDGKDIRSYSLEHLRNAISYVPQNGFLFSTSVSANIAFSSDEVPDEIKVRQSATVAAMDGEIEKFPESYATEIGERGVRLSGGQKQRVAIARMIYKDSPIRILDDSLSAVDTKTERRILDNLSGIKNQSRQNLTTDDSDVKYRAPFETPLNAAPQDERNFKESVTIVVSHRLSAVMNADEIILLDGGTVAERGDHAALLALDGLYARLWVLQSGEIGKSDSAPGSVTDAEILEVLRVEDEEAAKAEGNDE